MAIEGLSAATTKIVMRYNDQELSSGSAFFWRRDRQRFLITNWHNVTGRNADTNRHLSDTAAEPNKIDFDFWYSTPNGLFSMGASVDLFRNDRPVWRQHPLGRAVDIAAIPLPYPEFEDLVCLNDHATRRQRIRIALDVFLIGYPLGLSAGTLPIWKRGTIASEPEINVNDQQVMLVDTHSSSGMSGCPVILRSYSGEMEDGNTIMAAGGPLDTFIGVYSGRVGKVQGLDAQLGRVWKRHLIDELFAL